MFRTILQAAVDADESTRMFDYLFFGADQTILRAERLLQEYCDNLLDSIVRIVRAKRCISRFRHQWLERAYRPGGRMYLVVRANTKLGRCHA